MTTHLTPTPSSSTQSKSTKSKRGRKPKRVRRPASSRQALAPQVLTSSGGRETYTLLHGDCIEQMRTLEANSIDAVVTDPPYGIRLMGEAWDGADISAKVRQRRALASADTGASAAVNARSGGGRSLAAEAGKYARSAKSNREFQEWTRLWATDAVRVLKPGGYLVVFASPRTYHRMAAGVEDAGAEVVGQLIWMFGTGWPKSRNIALYDGLTQWEGFGTGLKPMHEPILLARKPREGTYAKNVLKWGTGLLNIDGCRIPGAKGTGNWGGSTASVGYGGGWNSKKKPNTEQNELGRWPGTVFLDEDAAAALEEQAPGASEFFYIAKPSPAERNAGLEQFAAANPFERKGRSANFEGMGSRSGPRKNSHPTVKSIELMRELCRLVTPPGGVACDPFLGSGSTGCAVARENADPDRAPGWSFIGIEREPNYLDIARARIEHWLDAPAPKPVSVKRAA